MPTYQEVRDLVDIIFRGTCVGTSVAMRFESALEAQGRDLPPQWGDPSTRPIPSDVADVLFRVGGLYWDAFQKFAEAENVQEIVPFLEGRGQFLDASERNEQQWRDAFARICDQISTNQLNVEVEVATRARTYATALGANLEAVEPRDRSGAFVNDPEGLGHGDLRRSDDSPANRGGGRGR